MKLTFDNFSTDVVKNMKLKKRECIKHDEDLEAVGIKMEAFKNYSRQSCLLECRAAALREVCHCLPYYYPNFEKVPGQINHDISD